MRSHLHTCPMKKSYGCFYLPQASESAVQALSSSHKALTTWIKVKGKPPSPTIALPVSGADASTPATPSPPSTSTESLGFSHVAWRQTMAGDLIICHLKRVTFLWFVVVFLTSCKLFLEVGHSFSDTDKSQVSGLMSFHKVNIPEHSLHPSSPFMYLSLGGNHYQPAF